MLCPTTSSPTPIPAPSPPIPHPTNQEQPDRAVTISTRVPHDQPSYSSDNPHPLSQMRTELVWEGKYDEYGNRREIDVAGLALTLQRIKTVDEPRSRALVQGRLFEPAKSHGDDFRNRPMDGQLLPASARRLWRERRADGSFGGYVDGSVGYFVMFEKGRSCSFGVTLYTARGEVF